MIAQVWRYHDKVGVYTSGENGKTVYLTIEQAREMAEALNKVANDLEVNEDFAKSKAGTFYIEEDGETKTVGGN